MKKTIALIMFFALAASFGVSAIYARSAITNISEAPNTSNSNSASKNKTVNSVCAQVITPAISPEGECKNFSTPCDVPSDWTKTDKCEMAESGVKKAKYEKIAENYNKLKNNFQDLKNDYSSAKEKFLQERLKVKNANKETLRKNSAEFLNKTVSVMIKYLESLKNKAENTGFVSEGEKNEIIARLDEDINSLTEKLSSVENATIEEQKNIAAEIRQQWADIRSASKRITGQMLSAKMNSFILKMEALRDKLKKEGVELNSETIQDIINNFNDKIELAKSENSLAKEKFAQINNKQQAGGLFKEGMQHMRSAHKYLKEAHKELVNLSQEIKKNRKTGEDGENRNSEDFQKEVETENETEIE